MEYKIGISFDLETTGIDKSKDSIIQFAGVHVDLSTFKIIKKLNLLIRPKGNYSISLGAYYKHGISPKILEDKPTFEEVADEIREFFNVENSAIITYNGLSFDLSFLAIEFARCGQEFTLIDRPNYDVFLEEKRRYGNTLEETFKRYYGNSMEEKGLKAHDALSDIKATLMVFKAQQETKPYSPEEVISEDNILKIMDFQGKMLPCFTVGKYRTIPLQIVCQLDMKYIDWILSDSCNWAPSTKKYIKEFKDFYNGTEVTNNK